MILVDTSVWIELINERLEHHREGYLNFAICGPIIQEVFQGLEPSTLDRSFQRALFSLPCLSDPIPSWLYIEAAEIYRQGRRRGCTIRSSVDCLIAAIAIENEVPVWHRDRDYEAIATFTKLEEVRLGNT